MESPSEESTRDEFPFTDRKKGITKYDPSKVPLFAPMPPLDSQIPNLPLIGSSIHIGIRHIMIAIRMNLTFLAVRRGIGHS